MIKPLIKTIRSGMARFVQTEVSGQYQFKILDKYVHQIIAKICSSCGWFCLTEKPLISVVQVTPYGCVQKYSYVGLILMKK